MICVVNSSPLRNAAGERPKRDYTNRGGCQIHAATSSVSGTRYPGSRAGEAGGTKRVTGTAQTGAGRVKPGQVAHTLNGEQLLQSPCPSEWGGVPFATAAAVGSSWHRASQGTPESTSTYIAKKRTNSLMGSKVLN